MKSGITYYKMKSPYEGDITKNCALTGPEVDNNFFTLEGRDVKSITVEDNDIILNLLNGDKLKAEDAFSNFIVNLEFNVNEGTLKLYYNNGDIQELKGFTTAWNAECTGITSVATDATLQGNGLPSKPLQISSPYKTGQYSPVNEIIKRKPTHHCDNNKHNEPKVGDRFIVEEDISKYGLLYDYKTVMQIACELQHSHSGWRIPTKEDWDDMLNAVEPCESDKTHSNSTPNTYLGKWAGKLLKSNNSWLKPSSHCDFEHEDFFKKEECKCHDTTDACVKPFYGEIHHCDCDHNKPNKTPVGIDKFGFNVMPSGYADDGGNCAWFGQRSYFWTATNMKFASVFIKGFDYEKTKVYQDIVPGQNFYPLRLVKDYNGYNYKEVDEILGQTYPTVLMPSEKKGKAIWTSINVYAINKHYRLLQPNNGHNLSTIKKFYIEEWDGKKWLRNELREGDSVVVKNAPNNQTNVEYRVTNGKLINTVTRIEQQITENVQVTLDDIKNSLNSEISRATNKEDELDKKINDLSEHHSNSFNDLNEKIDNEIEQRENLDIKINEELTDINKTLDKSVKWDNISEDSERKSITLKNNDLILGTSTNGGTYNLAMISKWNVADFGSNGIHMNLNSIDRITVNDDKEEVAYLSDIDSSMKESNDLTEKIKEELDNKINDLDNELTTLSNDIKDVQGQIITSEGSNFDEKTKILSLKSVNGENDIEIPIKAGYFGTF